MKRKSTRTSSAVDIYKDTLERKGLLKMVGSKRFDEFLEEVYTSLRREKESEKLETKKKHKSLSEGDVVVGKCNLEGNLEKSRLQYNVEENYYNNGYIQSIACSNNKQVDYSVSRNVDYNISKKFDYSVSRNVDVNNQCNSNYNSNNQYRPEENFYNNGYLQSVAHKDNPPCTNRTEFTTNVFDCGYIKDIQRDLKKFPKNDLYLKREEERPKSCTPPVPKEEIQKRPQSCDPFGSFDPRGIFGFPRVIRPKMNKKEVDLRIQAALGLLKLKHLFK